jgi:glycosyltransferase involved in cell wall biosynthesis
MTKKKSKNKKKSSAEVHAPDVQAPDDQLPLVSICTPTFNRRPFIKTMFECFKNQDYPHHRMEWIIVDDGTDKIKDLIETSNIPQIRYFEIENKIALGAKRNYMHKHVRGSIIVYMDDDDYYPPERVSHAVEMLSKDEKVLCAGASEIYLYFKTMGKMIQAGPYGPNHATAGTFAFKTKMLADTKYNDDAALAEEREFLKNYTIPFVQLDPLKTILVFSHEHNTFDKREMFKTAHPNYFKESPKTVGMFIRNESERSIKDFFMRDIDALLENYEPGLPNMKPDVLVQIKQIKDERAQMIEREKEKQLNGPITLEQGDGKPPIQLNSPQIVKIIQDQQETINKLTTQLAEINKHNSPIMLQQGEGIPPVQLTSHQLIDIMQQQTVTINNLNKKYEQTTNQYATEKQQYIVHVNSLQNVINTMEQTILEFKK